MSNKALNLGIGILYTGQTTPDYLRRFYQWGYPDFITPGKKVAKFDVVIIPDKISASVGLPCFQKRYESIGLPSVDNMAEAFRLYERGLEYYMQHSLIIGIGDGAVMLWDKLGFKASVVGPEAKIKLIRPEVELDTVWKGDDIFVEDWRHKNFMGVQSLWSNHLRDTLNEEKKKLMAPDEEFPKSGLRPAK